MRFILVVTPPSFSIPGYSVLQYVLYTFLILDPCPNSHMLNTNQLIER